MRKKIAIIGGGAAGFFAAINIAELHPLCEIHIFEKSNFFLQKVKISGGGRCNVTNISSEPAELITFYPRGNKELLGPFHQFNSVHTVEWFAKRRVHIIAEPDGRMFPSTNSSQTIIDLFLQEAHRNNIVLHTGTGVHDIQKNGSGNWELIMNNKNVFTADILLLTTGSSNQIWDILRQMNHTIAEPVPSLFTFKIKDKRLEDLMGLSVSNCICTIAGSNISTEGPLLITHWGLSGPSVLKLSAWAAKELHAKKYIFNVQVNFIPEYSLTSCLKVLQECKTLHPAKTVSGTHLFTVPARLYRRLYAFAGIFDKMNWGDLNKEQMQKFASALTQSVFAVNGKSNFKDEFVTCGGIDLKEVDFKTMQSKLHDRLFFAGEILNIDAVTGGFNFQAAWTTAFIAARGIDSIL